MTQNPPIRLPHDAIEHRLDRYMADWYAWRRTYQMVRGYSAHDSTCRDHRASSRYDWQNGVEEARGDEITNKGVDAAMDRVPNEPQPWNTFLQFEAMNLATGAAVWHSPRLPADPAVLEVLRREARNRLLLELRRGGVMT